MSQVATLPFLSVFLPAYHLRLLMGPLSPVRSLPIRCSQLPLSLMCWVLSSFSHAQLSVILWTVASQAPLSMGFFRQVYWNWLPLPPPGHLPDSGI